MTDQSGRPAPKNSETDPPAANQPLEDDDPAQAGDPPPSGSGATDAEPTPAPAPVPVSAPHGGQVPPGKPDGEVDTRP